MCRPNRRAAANGRRVTFHSIAAGIEAALRLVKKVPATRTSKSAMAFPPWAVVARRDDRFSPFRSRPVALAQDEVLFAGLDLTRMGFSVK